MESEKKANGGFDEDFVGIEPLKGEELNKAVDDFEEDVIQARGEVPKEGLGEEDDDEIKIPKINVERAVSSFEEGGINKESEVIDGLAEMGEISEDEFLDETAELLAEVERPVEKFGVEPVFEEMNKDTLALKVIYHANPEAWRATVEEDKGVERNEAEQAQFEKELGEHVIEEFLKKYPTSVDFLRFREQFGEEAVEYTEFKEAYESGEMMKSLRNLGVLLYGDQEDKLGEAFESREKGVEIARLKKEYIRRAREVISGEEEEEEDGEGGVIVDDRALHEGRGEQRLRSWVEDGDGEKVFPDGEVDYDKAYGELKK